VFEAMTSLLLVSPLVYEGKSARSNWVDLPCAIPGWLGHRLWLSLSRVTGRKTSGWAELYRIEEMSQMVVPIGRILNDKMSRQTTNWSCTPWMTEWAEWIHPWPPGDSVPFNHSHLFTHSTGKKPPVMSECIFKPTQWFRHDSSTQ